MPSVTIGLPVRNGATTIERALDSLLRQTFADVQIIICDNASTDGTSDICWDYARKHSSIRLASVSSPISQSDNYRRALFEADTPYFMWAAADDLWAPEFVAANHAFLQANPAYVASQSRVLFISEAVPSRMSRGTFGLRESFGRNAVRFFVDPADNSRFYGLFRTEALKSSFPATIPFAWDWLLSAATLRYGCHNEVPSILMIRDETFAANYSDAVPVHASSWVQRVLPLWPLTRIVVSEGIVPVGWNSIFVLVKLNIHMALRFATYRLRKRALTTLRKPSRLSTLVDPLARGTAQFLAPGLAERLGAAGSRSIASVKRRLPIRGSQRSSGQSVEKPKVNAVLGHAWQTFHRRAANRPTVSVIVVVNNQLFDILTMMQTLPAAMPSGDFELIVVDRGSTDATALCFEKRTELTYLPMPAGVDYCTAANAGTKKCKGKILVFVDADLVLHENSISALVEGLGSGQLTGPICLTPSGRIHARGGRFAAKLCDANIDNELKTVSADFESVSIADFCPGVISIDRSTFEHIGGFQKCFQSSYVAYAELGWRTRCAGGKIIVTGRSVVSNTEASATASDNVSACVQQEWDAFQKLLVGSGSTKTFNPRE